MRISSTYEFMKSGENQRRFKDDNEIILRYTLFVEESKIGEPSVFSMDGKEKNLTMTVAMKPIPEKDRESEK